MDHGPAELDLDAGSYERRDLDFDVFARRPHLVIGALRTAGAEHDDQREGYRTQGETTHDVLHS